MTIDLSEPEHELLLAVLQNAYTDLRMEIADTDSSSYKERLKAREELMQRLLTKLEAASGVSGS